MKISTLRCAAVATFAFLACTTSVHAQTAVKIAYINSQKIMAEAPGRAEAEATYEREMTAVRAQLQKMDDSLRTMVEAYQKERPSLDSAKRASREQMLNDKEEELSKQAQGLNQQMQQRQVELARPLLEQVSKVLDELREQNSYSMIFDVGSQASVVVSADKNLDITDKVLARLKQLGPPKASTTTTPAPAPAGPVQKPAGVPRSRN